MQPRFFIIPLLFFAFISLNMTCNQTVPNTDKPAEELGCIDQNKINPNKGCPRILAPVCGCDGKTYGNSCEADKNGVTDWTDGKCNDCIDKSKINPNSPCTREYVPVCGCDGKTYANKCEATKAGLREWVSGKCKTNVGDSGCIDESKINPDLLCMQVYQPVCGCDGKTYGNTCEAEKSGVTKWTEGACNKNQKDDCIDPAKITKGDCPDEYAPVCGCDGLTYSNVCQARLAGVTRWTEGKCK